MRIWRMAAVVAMASAATACSDETLAPAALPCTATVAGQCVGLVEAHICDAERCTDGVSCDNVIEIASDAELQAAMPSAGDCLALAPGSYGEADLPGGVSLLGRGAAFVTLNRVRLGAGTGAVVRGLAVTSGGIGLEGAEAVLVDRVRVTGAPNGIQADLGSSFELVDSLIEKTTQNGVLGYDAESISLRRTVVEASSGPGVWIACTGGCSCPSPPQVLLEQVVLRGHHVVGAALIGVEATLSDLSIHDIAQNLELGTSAGGLYVGECAEVASQGRLDIDQTATFGLMVHDASAGLGSTDDDAIIVINGSEQAGIWLSDIGKSDPTQTVTLDNFEVRNGSGVGLGLGIDALGIIVINGLVENTIARQLPVLVDGMSSTSDLVGHGVIWNQGASAQLEGLTLSGNALQSLLIDGAVGPGSHIQSLTQNDGDEAIGVIQQQATTTDASPSTDASASIQLEATQIAPVPAAPSAP